MPFSASSTVISQPLQLVHTDIQGPMPHTSLGGARYMLTMVDEYTDYHWAWATKSKSDAAGAIKDWIMQVERQTSHRVVTIRSDNGGEYMSNDFTSWLASLGITQQPSIPDTPQQNGKAERTNRTIEEKITALLMEYGLPGSFWAEALTYALYVLARTVRPSTGKTRYEHWHGRPATYDRIHVFGCTAFAHNPKHKKHQSKSTPCWFISPSEDSFGKQAYRLVHKRNVQKVIYSRNVIFAEDWTMRTAHQYGQNNYSQSKTLPAAGTSLPLWTPDLTDPPSALSQDIPSEPLGRVDDESTEGHSADVSGVDKSTADDHQFVISEDETDDGENAEDTHALPRTHLRPLLLRRSSRLSRTLPQANILIDIGTRQLPSTPPATYCQAVSGPFRVEWEAAMKAEMDLFEKLRVWTIRKADSKATEVVSGRWDFTCSSTANSHEAKFKARWVARWFKQREGTFGDTPHYPTR
ncbi:gag-pol polyprotein [Phaffia rhodozyma]|uniref:Gag-pol polyprotein n=1 Tax=Phaffia rhodozyma TaxID=264483 RepID=A0A0F7SLG3_PHARH|nr:gag-pol polyprotein [Phaffia rhodozyma]